MRGTSVEAGQTLILATDRSLSVLAEVASVGVNRLAYTPYGNPDAARPSQSRLGFNGQFREQPGWYHLGNGHRVYNPALRRFHSPDRLSPFDKGGLNPYTYCLGDPVNHTDPTGRIAQFMQIASFIGFGFGLFYGGISLLAPFFVKTAAATPFTATALVKATAFEVGVGAGKNVTTSAITHYAHMHLGLVGAPLGGLDALGSIVSLLSVPIGVPGTMLSMNEDPEDGAKELLMTGAIMGLFVLPVKALLVPFTPKLLTSKKGQWFSRLVHGRAKVESARQEAINAMRLKHYDAWYQAFSRQAKAAPPPLPPSPRLSSRFGRGDAIRKPIAPGTRLVRNTAV